MYGSICASCSIGPSWFVDLSFIRTDNKYWKLFLCQRCILCLRVTWIYIQWHSVICTFKLLSAFNDKKRQDNVSDIMVYSYYVEKVQLENAGKYQCKASYNASDVVGVTTSDKVQVVVLGKSLFLEFPFLPFCIYLFLFLSIFLCLPFFLALSLSQPRYLCLSFFLFLSHSIYIYIFVFV